jgi:cellulose biosynthesis protein BcsQ/tetratricopeptide (TPR) repeat protein
MDLLYSISYPEPTGPPQLTTFYSFKGGVGRTQSLYNVGVRLATLRRKVLMVDVDLEAPGLSIGALDERARDRKDGFAEIASDLLFELDVALDENPKFFASLVEDFQSRLNEALHVIDVPMAPRNEDFAERLQENMGIDNLPTGSLTLLATGRIDPDYPQRMVGVPIGPAFEQKFTDRQKDRLPELLNAAGLNEPESLPSNLGLLFTAVLRFLLRNAIDPSTGDEFQHVLIDSRSGLADVGGLCLRGLPDTRVVLSGLNIQNLEGTRMVLNRLQQKDRSKDRLIVVFSPVPEGETELVEKRVGAAKKKLYLESGHDRNRLPEDQIHLLHYHPRIALEERPFTESFHQRTRIYGEYESLTDRLLALTRSDADSLVDQALAHFDDAEKGEKDSYRQLVQNLLPAAFVDIERVETLVDGFCSQFLRSGHYEMEILPLFDLWTSLSPNDVRSLANSGVFFAEVGSKEELHDNERKTLLRRSIELSERATKIDPRTNGAWSNWGLGLTNLAHLIQDDNPNRAESLYSDAFDKFRQAVDINPQMHGAWCNWGVNLVRRSRVYRISGEVNQSDELIKEAIDKLEMALEYSSDDRSMFWLIIAHAERGQDEDIDAAAELLESALDEDPEFVSAFDSDEATTVREHPDLRAILDRYRTQVDAQADAVEDIDDLDGDLDAMN